MVKKLSLVLVLLLIFSTVACNGATYSYKTVTGHDTASIKRIETNEGYLQSFRQTIPLERAYMLDMKFRKTDRDIYSLTFAEDMTERSLSPLYTGIIYVFAEPYDLNFLIGIDGHIYCCNPNLKESYRSVEKLNDAFFAVTGEK